MWSDRESLHDCLGFTRYVDSLVSVCITPDIAPLAMGVFGSWGSGKTTLMRMMEKSLEFQKEQGVRTLWFNAWQYDGKEEIQSALINAILEKVQEGQSLVAEAKETLKRLKEGTSVLRLTKFIARSALTLTPDIGGFLSCFQDETDRVTKTIASFETDFTRFLEQMKVSRMVVFIDDLDRCQSKQVIETFETIKLFLNVPECTFVIGADDVKIRRAVEETYEIPARTQKAYADDYLEKIIQIPFRIPVQRLEDIQSYVTMLLLKRRLTDKGWEDLVGSRPTIIEAGSEGFAKWVSDNAKYCTRETKDVLTEIAQVAPYARILAGGLRGNPRQIKRFLNILELRRGLAEANKLAIEDERLIKLLVIEYTWRDFFDEVAETVDPASGSSELLVATTKGDLEAAKESQSLKSALETVGLVEFLQTEPHFGEKDDLTPYLFLAQTALSASRPTEGADLNQQAARFAERLSSTDRVRSRAAGEQLKRCDPPLVAAVIRMLGQRFVSLGGREQVQVLSGLAEVCAAQPQHYPAITAILSSVDPRKNEGLAIVGLRFLQAAEDNGVPEATKLEKAFGQLPLAKAFARKRSIKH